MTDENFISLLQQLAKLPEEAFWRECFSRYPSTRSMPAEKALQLGGRASDCGRQQARLLREEKGKEPVTEICLSHGIELKEFGMPKSPTMEIFALFEAPNTISIRTDILQKIDDYVRENGMNEVLGQFSCREVLLAHEFYHFLESRDGTLFTTAYRERKGVLRLPQELPGLSEIGAMSFAGELTGTGWSPFLLDCVMMSMNNLPAAMLIAERLVRFGAESRQ